MTYADKLKDPRWKAKRLEILEKNMFICADCYGDEPLLHVHHIYYESGLEPWEYSDEAYLPLCDLCHEIEHDRFDRYVGPERDMSLRKIGFRAKDYEELVFSSVGVALGWFTQQKSIEMVIRNIKRRKENYQRIVDQKIKFIGLAENTGHDEYGYRY